jgi:hypothetical protein
VVVRCFDKSVTTPYDDPFALPDEGH